MKYAAEYWVLKRHETYLTSNGTWHPDRMRALRFFTKFEARDMAASYYPLSPRVVHVGICPRSERLRAWELLVEAACQARDNYTDANLQLLWSMVDALPEEHRPSSGGNNANQS